MLRIFATCSTVYACKWAPPTWVVGVGLDGFFRGYGEHALAEDEVDAALPGSAVPVSVRHRMRVVRFSARLPTDQVDRLPVHQAATILVHAATKPGDVRGWTTFAEALPELAARSTADDLDRELNARPGAVRPRLAYLLSGVAPATADWLQPATPPSVTWFGSSRASRRYDKRFNVADGLLPFDPRSAAMTGLLTPTG
jgi:hypothetical protein